MDRDTPVSRRRTESRRAGESSSAVAVETTNGRKTTWLWEAGGRLVETGSVTAEQTISTTAEEAEDEEWIISSDDALPLIVNNDRPLPIRFPEFPEGANWKEIGKWQRATTVAYEKAAKDPISNPPILRETKGRGRETAKGRGRETPSSGDVISWRQREMIFMLSSSIVSISSTLVGNDVVPIWMFTGLFIGPSESDGHARILTSSDTVCNPDDGKVLDVKLLVRMPDKTVKDGELLFFDPYYDIAVLEISVDKPVRCPSFVASPDYGDKVSILARDKDSSLLTTTGSVMCHSKSYLSRNYYLYVSCAPPTGRRFGLVIDRDGDVAGLAFFVGLSKSSVLPSFIIRRLIEMERNFRCIARPVHHLCLREVQFLEFHKREEILYGHKIDNGYIVDKVAIESNAEKVGIRRGDVILSINAMRAPTLPAFEDYLLSLGWKFLERRSELSKVVLKLKVHDSIRREEYTVDLPLGFSCYPSVKKRPVKVQVAEKTSTSTKRKKTTPVLMPSDRVLRSRKKSENK